MDLVCKVKNESKDKTLRYLYEDKLLNAYAIYRLENEVEESATYVCLEDNTSGIEGYLSVFEAPDAVDTWVRGRSLQTLNRLLTFFLTEILPSYENSKKKLYVSSDPQFASVIKERFPLGKINLEYAMIVRKAEEKLSMSHSVAHISDRQAIEYTRSVVPHDYVITDELIDSNRKFFQTNLAYGIFDNQGRLLSTANALIRLPYVWVISSVETRPEYRRRGYASSVVSATIREAFQHTDAAMLYVNKDNYDAIRVYEKLGFRKIADFLELVDEISP